MAVLRPLAAAALAVTAVLAACGGQPSKTAFELSGEPPRLAPAMALPDNAVSNAVAKLDGSADDLLDSSGIPGMAVAVVRGAKTVYGRGFGVRDTRTGESADADTIFQLASLSKPLAATVVAHEVGGGNRAPSGIPETLTAEFADLVEFGRLRQDWRALYAEAFAGMAAPSGELAGKRTPADPVPARPLSAYLGSYANGYWGLPAAAERDGALMLTLGPGAGAYPLVHWDGDVFTFAPRGENATPGGISKTAFDGKRLTLEYLDSEKMGTFTR